MCGIAGIFHPDVPKPVSPARIEAMCDVLAHRGPDGSGVWTAPGVGLGHRRLSIIDLEGGAQPMLTPDQRVAVTYNGEIYNFQEVRAELERKGHAFRTGSDTEVILAGWRQWGPDCLSRFNGMFALALYDADRATLFLARDRLGVKPLFYAELSDGALIFASELKGLLVHPLLRRALILRRSNDLFRDLVYVPVTPRSSPGVKKLPRRHFLPPPSGRPLPLAVRWWDVDSATLPKPPLPRSGEELVEHLREAVRSRMIADVPLGAFLSAAWTVPPSSPSWPMRAEARSRPARSASISPI
jgi:asparagine synthase (glutamine-hydrolysing)